MESVQGKHRETMNLIFVVLRYWGLWSYFDDSSIIKKILYFVYSTVVISVIWFYIGTLVADCVVNSQDMDIIVENGCHLAGINLIIFKLLIFRIRRKEIIKLVDKVHQPVDSFAKSSDKGTLMLLNLTTFYDKLRFYGFGVLGSFLILGLVASAPTKHEELPVRGKFPFNETEEPMHTVALVIQVFSVSSGIIAILCMDSIVLNFYLFLNLQLVILNSNYRHCRTESPCGNLESKKPEKLGDVKVEIECFIPFGPEECGEKSTSFMKRFKLSMRHHQRLLDIVDDLNVVFGSSLFCQLLTSCSMICLTGFQATHSSTDNADLMKFGLYWEVAFSQIFIWCFFGNMLLDQGSQLTDSQWQSGWEKENIREVAHLMIVSMARGMRKFEVKAMDFFVLSLETFVKILRASYSVFTLLATVSDDE